MERSRMCFLLSQNSPSSGTERHVHTHTNAKPNEIRVVSESGLWELREDVRGGGGASRMGEPS